VLTAGAPFSATNWSAPSASSIDPGNTVLQLACPTSSTCIAADDNGNVLTSTTPPFGASASWSSSTVDPFRIVTGLACSLNVFCVIGDDAGNVLAGTEGIGPPANSAPTAVAPTLSCTIRAKSANVFLPPAKKATRKRKRRRPKPGTLSFVVRCNQTAAVTLQGKLTELVKGNRGRRRRRTFVLPRARGSAQVSVALTLTVKLPRSALTALMAHARESVKVTLTASDVGGTSITAATIRRLKPVATH
jgi:hypothetical protein